MNKVLRIADDFTLPIGIANKTICLFGKGGSGKSNLEVVLAEELYRVGVPTCIVDPADIHYGIKSARDGKSAGLPFIVFGGLHADVPIYPENGALLADLFLDRGLYMVIVTQPWTGGERNRFMTDFANQLYKRGPEKEARGSARVLILEEAHEYVPLNPGKGEEVMLGAMKRLYTVGRNYWIGFIAATRRPAKLHTDLRNGADATAFFQIVGTQDRKAMMDYLAENAEPEIRQEILQHLAKLPVGTAYFYQPHDNEHALAKVHFRHRNTFDTTTTEITAGHKVIKPVLAPVDLTKLGEAMNQAREKAKQDDPKELRRTIVDLQCQLKAKGEVSKAVTTKVERLEIPVMKDAAVHRLEQIAHAFERQGKELTRWGDVLGTVSGEILQALGKAERSTGERRRVEVIQPAALPPSRPAALARVERPPVPRPAEDAEGQALGLGERKVLGVLAQWPDGRTQRDLAFLTGYSARASTIGVILSKLRKLGLVEPGQPVRATEAGFAQAGGSPELPTGPELLEYWFKHPRVGEGERKVLRVLVEAFPEPLTHQELGDRTNYSTEASTLGVILSKLRKLGLVEARERKLRPEFAEAIAS